VRNKYRFNRRQRRFLSRIKNKWGYLFAKRWDYIEEQLDQHDHDVLIAKKRCIKREKKKNEIYISSNFLCGLCTSSNNTNTDPSI
jgi:hypothetical protein